VELLSSGLRKASCLTIKSVSSLFQGVINARRVDVRLRSLSRTIQGVTQPETVQWLNPDAFVSAADPSTGACAGGDKPRNCQFGILGRNALRGPGFFWSDLYLTKWFQLSERVKVRI